MKRKLLCKNVLALFIMVLSTTILVGQKYEPAMASISNLSTQNTTNLGDFEDGTLQNWSTWADPSTLSVIDNPDQTGINTSTKCVKITQTSTYASPLKYWFNTPIWSDKAIKLTADVYMETTENVKVMIENSQSSAASIENYIWTNSGAWTTIEVDLSGMTAYDYQQVYFQFGAVGYMLIDNIKYVEQASVDPVTSIDVSGMEYVWLNGGATYTADVEPSTAPQTVTWSVNDESIATIDASTGELTSVAAGTVEVKASATDASGVTGTLNVEVKSLPAYTKDSVLCDMEDGDESIFATWGSGVFDIVDNPDKTGINSSDSVLSFSQTSWEGVKIYNSEKPFRSYYVKASFDVYLTAAATVQMNLDQGNVDNVAKEQAISTIDEWVHVELNVNKLTDTTFNQVWFRLNQAAGSFYIDNITYEVAPRPLTAISVTGTNTITTDKGTTQLTANLTPTNTTTPDVTWSLTGTNASDIASIDQTGLVTAIRNGSVTAVATSDDNGSISNSLEITISNQNALAPTALVIADASASVNDEDVQLTIESSTPSDADKSVTWSITSIHDPVLATITDAGVLTPIRNGTVTVKATSIADASVSATKDMVISNQVVEATAVTITSANTITTDDGTLELAADVTPADAVNKNLVWSISSTNDPEIASLSGTILTAQRNGKVTVKAAISDDANVFNEMEITISGQSIALQSISITGDDISTNAGTSQMTAVLNPADAENVEIIWTLRSAADSAKATISTTGLLTAFANGDVTVVAKDKNSDAKATETITISGQVVVDSIALTTAGDAVTISENGGSLQVYAEVLPADARIKDIVWSIVSAGGDASIDHTGLVKAQANGDVFVKVTAQDAGARADSVKIAISGQVLVQSVDILVSADTIKEDDGTLILPINVSPDNAADTTVTWSIVSDTANVASIDATTGLITAIRNGGIKIMAVANSNASLKDSAIVVIENQKVAPTAITLMGADSAKTITVNNGELQISAIVTPEDAVADVEWGIAGDKFDIATVSETGLVTAFRDGVVFVQATSTLAPAVSGKYEITITNQIVEPTEIEIVSETGKDSILVNNGTLSLLAKVTPDDADADVTWSIDASDKDTASISDTGILTAIRNGKVTVKAVSNVADTVMDTFEVTIVNQVVEPTAISIVGTDSISTIDVDNGTLVLLINTTPADAVKDVYWSMAASDADTASIDSLGVVTAKLNGVATVMAMSVVDSAVVDTFDVTITNQVEDVISPDSILVKGEGGVTEITTVAGTLQMIADVYPVEADSTVIWSIEIEDTALASISETGLLAAKADGTVTVIATSTVADKIQGKAEITISGQVADILVTSIEVSAADDATGIDVKGGTLQLTATIDPDDATNKKVEWNIDKTELASVSAEGLVTAIADGEVVVTAKAKDGSEVSGSITLIISNQSVAIVNANALKFEVYPNPAINVINVSITAQADYRVIDLLGQTILVGELDSGINSLDISDLKNGNYFLVVQSQFGSLSKIINIK